MFALVLGGSTDRLERGALSTGDLFSLPQLGGPHPFPQLRVPRRSPALFSFAPCGHLLAIGGCSGPGEHLNSAEMLSFPPSSSPTASWELTEYMDGIQPFSCAAFCQLDDGTGFIFGGYDGRECFGQVVKIGSAEPHRAERLTQLQFGGLKNAAALPAVDSKRIWLVGGWDGRRTLRTIMEYDVTSQRCEMRCLLPYPLEGHCMAKSAANSPALAFIVGGFDGTSLRTEILVMCRRSGRVLDEAAAKMEKARENCVAFCYADNNEGQRQLLAVMGGWDGHRTLGDLELFEVLPESPWLKKADEWTDGNKLEQMEGMVGRRNRPAVTTIVLEPPHQ